MDSVSQLPSPRSLSNKLLHDLQFLVATGFESAGIVKNVTAMIGEDKFILDVVLATLSKDQAQPKRCTRDTNVNGRVKSNLEGSETALAGLQSLDCVPPYPPGKRLDCP
jgi:hypothetical protein